MLENKRLLCHKYLIIQLEFMLRVKRKSKCHQIMASLRRFCWKRGFKGKCSGALLCEREISRNVKPLFQTRRLYIIACFTCFRPDFVRQTLPLKHQQFREESSSERTLILLNHDIYRQTSRTLVFIRLFQNVFGQIWCHRMKFRCQISNEI